MSDFKLYGGRLQDALNQSVGVLKFPTAHMQFAAKHIIHDEYSYDVADDGPEINIIRSIDVNSLAVTLNLYNPGE